MVSVKGDPEQARKINRSLILTEVRKRDTASRAELARALSISKMTVSTIVAELIEDGFLVEQSSTVGASNAGGRRPILLSLDRTENLLIGVDIGTTNITLILGNLKGETIRRMRTPTHRNRTLDKVADQIEQLVADLLAASGTSSERIVGVGLSVAGLVNKAHGFVKFSPDFGWENVYFQKAIEERLHLPVVIDNCSRVAALGEMWYGAAKDVDAFFYANVGYGIGSAIVTDRQIYRNNSEFGHIHVTNRDVKCDCGKRGCLEAVSSGHAIEREANHAHTQSGSSFENQWITAQELADQAESGDLRAQEIFDNAGKYLGRGLSTVANLLSPELLVVGGGVSNAGSILMDPLMQEFNRHTMNAIKENTSVVVSELGMYAGVIGAVALAMDTFVIRGEEVPGI